LLCERKPQTYRFKDDGVIPNHPLWPLIIYKSAVRLPECLDPAAVFEELFESRGWGHSWRDGIYDYVHYHSSIHEVLGIARGSARVRFGGAKGRALNVRAGDVAILPAGTHLGMPEAAKLLNETLQEEMNAEKLLTRIAKSKADKTAATKIAA
jgi:uncharacterized protein YjlB